MPPRRNTRKAATKLRSSCAVASTLDLVGDKWSLLVIRDLLHGKRTYGEIAKSPEGIPTNILADRLARLEQAVLRLKPLTRQIFLACRLDGYSYVEIAEQTGLSVRGVEKQMSRAIKQLGRHLRHHD